MASGKMVIIPEKETTIGSYTGYGYILLDNDTGAGAYMISGGINGGMSPELVGIASIVDLGIAVYGLVEVVSMLLSMVSLMAAAGPVGIVAGLAASAFLIYLAVDVLAKTFDLVEAAINGDEAAAGQIFTDIVINIAFIIGAKAVSKLLGGFLNKLILNGAIKNCGEEVVERIVKQYGDDALRYLKKYGDDFVRICDTHGDDGYKLVKDFGDNFVKLYAKYGDDVYKYVNIYGDEALKLFKNYGDDLIKAIGKYGDDGFKLYYRFGDKALVYVEQYGDEALKLLTGENGYRAFNEFSNGKTLDEVRKVVEGGNSSSMRLLDDELGATFLDNMKGIRKNIPKTIRGRYNFGYAEVEIEGISKTEYFAHSGIKDINSVENPLFRDKLLDISVEPLKQEQIFISLIFSISMK